MYPLNSTFQILILVLGKYPVGNDSHNIFLHASQAGFYKYASWRLRMEKIDDTFAKDFGFELENHGTRFVLYITAPITKEGDRVNGKDEEDLLARVFESISGKPMGGSTKVQMYGLEKPLLQSLQIRNDICHPLSHSQINGIQPTI